jgi:hypothetical protein
LVPVQSQINSVYNLKPCLRSMLILSSYLLVDLLIDSDLQVSQLKFCNTRSFVSSLPSALHVSPYFHHFFCSFCRHFETNFSISLSFPSLFFNMATFRGISLNKSACDLWFIYSSNIHVSLFHISVNDAGI